MPMRSPSCRRAAAVLMVAATLAASPAFGSWGQPHTLQDVVPLPEVERSLVTGKSWFVFDLDFRFKRSTSHFIGDTPLNLGFAEGTHWERESNEGRWTWRRWDLGISWGFTGALDLYARIPVVWGSAWNSRMGDDPISGVGLGDLHSGVRVQLLRTQNPNGRFSNSLIGQIDFRVPTGQESPGSYIPGPNNVATIITGAGTWGIDLAARYKQQIAILAVEVGLGYLWNPTGTVMYLLETEENQFNQHLDPGDVVHGDLGLTVQFFDHLALRGDLFLDYRTPSRWGSTSDTFPACKECAEIPNSNGLYMDVQARVISDFDIHFGLDAYFRYTLAGRHNFLWPLEEISPSRGWTLGGDVAWRF